MSASTDISELYREFTDAPTEVLAENAIGPARRGHSQERGLRLSGILTTASPDIFKQSTLLSTTGKLCKRLAGDGSV